MMNNKNPLKRKQPFNASEQNASIQPSMVNPSKKLRTNAQHASSSMSNTNHINPIDNNNNNSKSRTIKISRNRKGQFSKQANNNNKGHTHNEATYRLPSRSNPATNNNNNNKPSTVSASLPKLARNQTHASFSSSTPSMHRMRASPALVSSPQINHIITNHNNSISRTHNHHQHHSHSHHHNHNHNHNQHAHIARPSAYSALPPNLTSASTVSSGSHSNSNLSDYAIYGHNEEMQKVDQLIDRIDSMVTAIRGQHDEDNAFAFQHSHNHNARRPQHRVSKEPLDNRYECALYEDCAATLCAPNDEKLAEIRKELKLSEKFIKNKYDFKHRVICNEYEESLNRAANVLRSKYEDRICKHGRLFKTEFAKQQRKIDKAKKKALALQQQQQQQTESGEVANKNGHTEHNKSAIVADEHSSDFVIEIEKYKRAHILQPDDIDINVQQQAQPVSTTTTAANSSGDSLRDAPTFSHAEMQSKWDEIKGLTDKEMEADVNTMVADQSNMNVNHKNHNNNNNNNSNQKNPKNASQRSRLEIRDILAMFPKCDVRYSSDKNTVTVNYDKSHQALLRKEEEADDDDNSSCVVATQQKMTIKVGSYIACRYKKQADMVGEVVAISSKGIWCRLRKTQPAQGQYDTLMDYTLNEIKLQSIEDGTVKIKLVH